MMDLNIRIAFWIGDLIVLGLLLRLIKKVKRQSDEIEIAIKKNREYQMYKEVTN